jgi:hypothetical protein
VKYVTCVDLRLVEPVDGVAGVDESDSAVISAYSCLLDSEDSWFKSAVAALA